MASTRSRSGAPPRWAGTAAAAAGLAGGVWGGAAAAVGSFEPAAFGFALLAVVGGLAARRAPALACAALFLASFGALLAVGLTWLGPGTLLLAASLLALWAIENPFAAEVERERRARGHGRRA